MTSVPNDSDSAFASQVVVANDSFKLVQISDFHLQQSPKQSYRGIDVEQRLLAVLQHIRDYHTDIDALLLSGDLVHHGYLEGYRRLVEYMQLFDCPWYWIPGNHDSVASMNQVRQSPSPGFVIPGWRVVLLDSTSSPDGCGAGALAACELQRLQQQLLLAEDLNQSLLLVLHHNPVPVASQWQDAIMLSNADELWAMLEGSPVAVTALFGHLHQQWDLQRGGVRLLGCPATSVQFKAKQPQLVIEQGSELAAPGYRWLTLPAVSSSHQRSGDSQQHRSKTRQPANLDQIETAIVRVGLA
ncbi:MAG: metallophosphoesterase [Motiliproteus sp.]